MLASHVDVGRFVMTLVAFFAAVGIAAHALDELHGRPLRTGISGPALIAAAIVGLLVGIGLGTAVAMDVGWGLVPFLIIGPVLVVGYDLELFGGRIHTDLGFALAWGAFPLLSGYVAQTGTVSVAAIVAALGAAGLAAAQRALSTPARLLRRQVRAVDGSLVLHDDTVLRLDAARLLAPLEATLRALSWSIVALATALALSRWA
jgi:hypothetical protein